MRCWYHHAPVARVVVPLVVDSADSGAAVSELGWLVLEKQHPALERELAEIASRSLLASLGFGLLLLLLLLAFASIHSWRIRRLARYLGRYEQAAQGSTPVALAAYPQSRVNDEIGQLSRSFHSLLGRLAQHQEYLKNLASKLSHELRTPIAVVQSSLDNMQPSPHEQPLKYAPKLPHAVIANPYCHELRQSVSGTA